MIWIKGVSSKIVDDMRSEGFIFDVEPSVFDMEDGSTDYNDIIIKNGTVKYYSFGDENESTHETIVLDQKGQLYIIYHDDFINMECGI